ncbi:cathepsin B-like [Patiria miniata]|uniref:Peptidase C1A papain C-terminal domain-containing protein n=1 Tax=Patiria miniata TaxID=46514 RepID=A0A913ZJV8_PATMI|nr:cathepsin B-like [Patiria miniata]
MGKSLLCCFLIGQLLLCCHGDRYQGGSHHPIGHLPALSGEMIRYVNNLNTTWKAGFNFPGKNASFVKLLLGGKLTTSVPDDHRLPLKPRSDVDAKDIPENFDSMTKWPECDSMKKIYDQGACGAGWAFGALEAMSDRYCVFSNMKKVNVTLSEENLISCCGTHCGFGCEGGYPSAAWQYWVNTGIVTDGCQPYTFDPCRHVGGSDEGSDGGAPEPTCAPETQTPKCHTECGKGYNKSYTDDLHFGKSSYAIEGSVTQIQEELINFGPVETSLNVFEDFFSYKSGVYQHVAGGFVNRQSVKMYGWGVTPDGVKYWLASNSWNDSWGEKGFFKILRGTNECGIEEDIFAGIPQL